MSSRRSHSNEDITDWHRLFGIGLTDLFEGPDLVSKLVHFVIAFDQLRIPTHPQQEGADDVEMGHLS